ncbi:MAG TPA: hypothetical protein VNU94_01250 [Acidobacteriaceae bacterium]|jgi:hypothetical protein|nr:hypothetical protein [Acidobacteriaceae bacterium]
MNFLSQLLQGITMLPNVVQSVESLAGAQTGAQKKDAALSIVGSAINIADAVGSKQIADASAFQGGLGKVIDGVVDCLNASVWSKAS